MATTPRAVRLTEAEIAFIQALLAHYPEFRTEADVQYQATKLGLWLLATAARRPGLPAHGGLGAADLAVLLRPRLLPALDFLAEQGMLPTLVQVRQEERVEPVGAAGAFEAAVADDMADLGTAFMD